MYSTLLCAVQLKCSLKSSQFHLATTTGAGVSMTRAASVPSNASSWQILHYYCNLKSYRNEFLYFKPHPIAPHMKSLCHVLMSCHLKIFYLSSERWKANLNVRSKNARVHVKNLTDEPVSSFMLCLIPFHQFMCSGHMTWVSKKDINGMEFMDGLTFLGLSLCCIIVSPLSVDFCLQSQAFLNSTSSIYIPRYLILSHSL